MKFTGRYFWAIFLFSSFITNSFARADVNDLTTLSLEELSKLEVTSVSKSPQKLQQAAAAIYVITQDDIRRSGATSIAEALRMAPGVDVERINSNEWSVGIRGFGDRLSRSVLVLIDGRAVYSPLFAGTYWELQDYPLEDIDRIEVIRGPGGTLWGANAFDGVINIITKSAKDTQGTLVSAGAGTEERGFGTVRYGGHVGDDFHYRAYGKYFNRDDSYHANNDNFDAWQMGQSGFRTDWNINSRDSLTMQGDAYKGQMGEEIPTAVFGPPYLQTVTQNADAFGANLLGRWKREFSSTSDMALQWYWDRTNRDDLNFSEIRNTGDIDFQHRFGWFLNQEITWGFEYRLTADRITSIPSIVFNPSDRTDHLGTAFIQDEVGLIPDYLQLTFGTKIEHNDFSGWEEEPSGRLAWTPTKRQTLWTSVSRAVATPSQVDQDLTATLAAAKGVPIFAVQEGNPNFESEKLTAYEAGYRVQPADSLFMDFAAFYNRYNNLLAGEAGTPFLQLTPTPAIILPVLVGNEMEGETHGLELASTWNMFSWWRWKTDYSLLLIHLRSAASLTAPQTAAGSSPRHQASLQWAMDLPYHFEWDPTLRYTDVLSDIGSVPGSSALLSVAPYWEMDMRVSWHATPHLELSIVGQNLLQSHHPEANSTTIPAVQELQRGFYGQLRWTW